MSENNAYERIKSLIRNNPDEVQLVQIGITSAVASLIYSEFLRKFRQVMKPVPKIFIPEVSSVTKLLNIGGEVSNHLSDTMINYIASNYFVKLYSDIPELKLFKEDMIEPLKSIFELYMLPNIVRTIPSLLIKKFGLDDSSKRTFIESGDIDIFDNKPLTKQHYDFMGEQAICQILTLIPSIEKEVQTVENNMNINVDFNNDAILSIANDNAMSVIHFNTKVLALDEIMPLLSFVTNTHIVYDEDTAMHSVTTSSFNQVIVTTLDIPFIEG